MARVVVTEAAQRDIAALPVSMRPRISDVLIRLGNWPVVSGAKALSGDLRGNWRIRTGDFRVLFRVEEEVVSVVVVWKVGNRRDVYDDE